MEWVVVGNFEEKFLDTLKEQEKLIKCGSEIKDRQPLTLAKVDRDITYSTKLTAEEITTSGCIKYHEVGYCFVYLEYTARCLTIL